MKTTKIYLVENCYGDINKVYIGKTKNNREIAHKIKFGLQIIYTYIDEIDSTDRKDWKPLECFWIEQFRQWGFELMNKNEGGNGPGFHTEETKQKISKANKGFKYSEESKRKMRGKSCSEETRKKISESKKGKTYSEEHNQKISKTKKGISFSEEHKQNMSKAKKGISFSEEHKQNMSKALKGIKLSEEHKQKIGEGNKGKVRSEETRCKISKARSKPILQYDLDENFIREWKSAKNAAKTLGFKSQSSIGKCCNGGIEKYHNFIWKHKNLKLD